MKLNPGDWLIALTEDNANDSVYAPLRVDEVWLALQIHQQYSHIYKPQKYTHPKTHTAFLFSMAILKKQQMKADWGVKILKDIKKVGPSFQRIGYIKNEVILTRIVYEAIGIRNKIWLMPSDEELLEAIKSQRAGTHKQVKRKAQQVISSTSEEEQSNKEDIEEKHNEKEKFEEQA